MYPSTGGKCNCLYRTINTIFNESLSTINKNGPEGPNLSDLGDEIAFVVDFIVDFGLIVVRIAVKLGFLPRIGDDPAHNR